MLDRTNVLPLYVQVKNKIINKINSDIYPVGSKIPTETQLQEDFDVSRITIRRAITELENGGYLLKQQGKGTFVKQPRVKRDLLSLNSYTDFMNKQDTRPDRSVVFLKEVKPDVNVQNRLQIDNENMVVKLGRVMKLAENNYGYEVNYYPVKLFPGIQNMINNDSSVTKILHDNFNSYSSSNRKVLNINSADSNLANLMHIDTGDPVYKVEKVAKNADETPLYYSVIYYNANKVSFVIDSEA